MTVITSVARARCGSGGQLKRAARPHRSLATLGMTVLLAFGCSRAPQHANVLFITIDTFRADRITANTPNLMNLAQRGAWFRNADAAVPMTLPSHATLLSGLLPLHHGLRVNGTGAFPSNRETLGTIFSRAGYRTAAFVSAFVLDHRFGLNHGFATYDDGVQRDPNSPAEALEAERRGGDTVDHALAWLRDQHDAPWFAWIHLYDAHAPYAPPAPLPQTYDGEIARADAIVGAKQLRRRAVQCQLAQAESRARFVYLGGIERATRRLHAIVGVLEIDLVRKRRVEDVFVHPGRELVIRPERLVPVRQPDVTAVKKSDFGNRHDGFTCFCD